MGRYPFRTKIRKYEVEMKEFLSPSSFGVYHRYLYKQARRFEWMAREGMVRSSNPSMLTPEDMITYIRYLREKVDRPYGRSSIETVRGVGYRLRKDGS